MNYKQLSKITIYSVIMAIFAIVGITCFALSLPTFSQYGFNALMDGDVFNKDNLLPISVQEIRGWSAASLVICILLTSLNIWEIKKMEEASYKKHFIASLGIFTWLMLPYTLYLAIKNKAYQQFFNHISQNRDGKNQISFKALKGGVLNYAKKDHLFWNTVFAIFLFIVTLVGFIFCLIIPEYIFGVEVIHKIDQSQLNPNWTPEEYYNYIKPTGLFDIFIFFTQLTNMTCFLFMLSFLCFHQKIAFRNNTIMIAVTSYIFIVSAIFWAYLFPQALKDNDYVVDFQWVKTTWLHAVTPILFIIFLISSLFVSKQAPRKFKKMIGASIIYPSFYGVFIYSLPFYTRVSVYGALTNLNPSMNTSIGMINPNGEVKMTNGDPLMTLGLAGLVVLFILVIFGFWSCAYLIHQKEFKRSQTV
ncbi:MAG: DUF1600 domain-containing protein [Metamycoplasmataceae bacterium]